VALFGAPQIRGQRTPTMQTELTRPTAGSAGRLLRDNTDDRRELALLAEFMRHNSVASLAGEIAERLGADVRGEELIAAADLGASRRDSRRSGDPKEARSRP
jgi:hypothetical protein